MADRVTKVTLTASVAGYISGMDAAAKKTREAASEADKLKRQGEAFQAVGRGALAFGTLAAVGVGLAVAKFAEFDQAMSNVQAATHESAAGMAALRDAALAAGQETVFSATEAANAIEELSKAGVSTADILNGALDGALSLAAAGGLGVAEAAEIASKALNQFNLDGSQTEHIADVLAAGAGKAAGDVTDLGMALSQVGQVANSTGLTIEETTTALAAFASQGLLGSDAGTSLKTMLGSLTPNSAKAREEMERLGISAFNARGEFIGLEEFAGNLQSSLSGLTDEQRQASLEIIFGQDAVRAATALYNEGAEGIAEWTDKVVDQGYAAETARIRLDNLNGDLEKLGGALDTVFIKSGSGANDTLRALTQGATGLVDAVGDLPAPVVATGLAIGGLVGTMGLLTGATLLGLPKLAEFRTTMRDMNISGGSLARTLGGVSGAIAIAGAAFAVWAQRQAEATAVTQELEASLDSATGAITEYTREVVARQLAEKGVFEAAKEAGISQRELTDAVLEGGDALRQVQDQIEGNNNLVNFFTGVGVRAGDAARQLDTLAVALPKAKQNLDDQKAAAAGSAESTQTAAEAYQSAAEEASVLQTNLQELIDTVNEANGVGQDAVSSNAAYQSALEDVRTTISEAQKGVEGYSTSLDESTAAGANNAAMFAELASKSQTAAAAQLALDGDTEKYRSTLEAGRQALYDQILALTGNADAAQALTDKIYAIPSQKEIDIIADTAAAQGAVDSFIYENDGKRITITADVAPGTRTTVGNGTGFGFANGGQVPHLSGGSPAWWRDGVVQGPGGPREDRVRAMLSPGEFVVNADATRKNLALLHSINSGRYDGDAHGAVIQRSEVSFTAQMHPIRDNDPLTTATVMGREFARRAAG